MEEGNRGTVLTGNPRKIWSIKLADNAGNLSFNQRFNSEKLVKVSLFMNDRPLSASEVSRRAVESQSEWLLKIARRFFLREEVEALAVKRDASKGSITYSRQAAAVINYGSQLATLVLVDGAEMPPDIRLLPRVRVELVVASVDSEIDHARYQSQMSKYGLVLSEDALYDHVVDGAATYPEGVRIYIHASVSDVGVDADWGIANENVSIYCIESQQNDALVVKRMTKIPCLNLVQSQLSNGECLIDNGNCSVGPEAQRIPSPTLEQPSKRKKGHPKDVKKTDGQDGRSTRQSQETEHEKGLGKGSERLPPKIGEGQQKQSLLATHHKESAQLGNRATNPDAQSSVHHFTTNFAAYQQSFLLAQRMVSAANEKSSKTEEARNWKDPIPIAPRFPVCNDTFMQTIRNGLVQFSTPQVNNECASVQNARPSTATARKRKRISLPLTASMKTHRIRVAEMEAGVTANSGSLHETDSDASKESDSRDEGKSSIVHKNANQSGGDCDSQTGQQSVPMKSTKPESATVDRASTASAGKDSNESEAKLNT